MKLKCPRLFGWLITTILLLAVIGFMYPQQLTVSLYKLSLVTMAAVVGYWLDRALFPYARPGSFVDKMEPDFDAAKELDDGSLNIPWEVDVNGYLMAMCMLRRAVIVGCAMLAIGLGA
jgi:hypothetical protein